MVFFQWHDNTLTKFYKLDEFYDLSVNTWILKIMTRKLAGLSSNRCCALSGGTIAINLLFAAVTDALVFYE